MGLTALWHEPTVLPRQLEVNSLIEPEIYNNHLLFITVKVMVVRIGIDIWGEQHTLL